MFICGFHAEIPSHQISEPMVENLNYVALCSTALIQSGDDVMLHNLVNPDYNRCDDD